MRNICRRIITAALLTECFLLAYARQGKVSKPRIVIPADPELDDNNTVIRAILYRSDFKIEGLIYASSQFHWAGDGKGTTQYIPGREYTASVCVPAPRGAFDLTSTLSTTSSTLAHKVYANLKIHDPSYPTPAGY